MQPCNHSNDSVIMRRVNSTTPPPLRSSAFGLLSDFDLRPSDFPQVSPGPRLLTLPLNLITLNPPFKHMKPYFVAVVAGTCFLALSPVFSRAASAPTFIYETPQEFFGRGDFDGDGRSDIVIVDKET